MARLARYYLAAGVPLAVVYMLLPADTASLVVWPIIGWSSVLAIVIGATVNRPASRAAWYLLAIGVATLVIGDGAYNVQTYVRHADVPFPSFVDVVYLSMYPLLITGLSMLVRRRRAGRDRAAVIDAAIITAGLGLVWWVVLIVPYVRVADLGVLDRLTSMAYPIGDVALLAIVVRLAVGGGRRPAAFWLLAGSLVPMIAADGVYGYLSLAGTWQEHSLVDLGWIAFYIGWGAAALHPSMSSLSTDTVSPRRITRGRLLVIGSAVLVPPAVLFVEQAVGDVTDAFAIAAGGAVIFALVLIRIAGLASAAADQRSEARFQTLVDNASDAIVVIDGAGRVTYQTPSTERVLGFGVAELDGRLLGELLAPADERQLRLMLSNDAAAARVEWRLRRGEGDYRDLEVVVADMRGTAGVDGLVLTMRDITGRKHLEQELRRQALHDALTGLPNRTLFLDRVSLSLQRAERHRASVAVLVLDVDDLKMVNDSLGYTAGDELLEAVGARLATVIRPGDTVARLGGDEFAVLLENPDVGSDLDLAATTIQAALQAPFFVRQSEVPVHTSIGMAVGMPGNHTPDDLLRDAGMAMYVAKRKGKDRFEQYLPAMQEEASRRLEVAAELRGAIDRNELVLFYQPIVDVVSGAVFGAEALVRWQHPRRGLLSPSEFIPVAETTGLVVPLGRWVLNEACRQAKEWKERGTADDSFYVSVNLSARHFGNTNVVGDVRDAVEASGLAAEALVVEVTETALMEHLGVTRSALALLQEFGVRIAVDDFGTGYSSLAYLSTFPVDILKIDKSFVDRVADTIDGETMVRTVVNLAHTLGLNAIAEGVEHPEQALALEQLGCRLAQGFLFAKPMPAGDMAALLRHRSVPHLVSS